ncbi:MAG: hypothetical protein HYW48_00460 [Deltaproteobacteria bacterium]|nr:hypothetical protein [Deltaproteobacteria bacterium]
MRTKFYLFLLCIITDIVILSCKTRTARKPSAAAKEAALAEKGACPEPDVGLFGPREPMSLAGLQLASGDVKVSSTDYKPNAFTTRITVDPFALGRKNNEGLGLSLVEGGAGIEVPPVFVMWKACQKTGQQCSNNGNWAKSYDFTINDLSKLPTGVLTVSIRACVEDLALVVPQEQSALTNSCTSEDPCYCGKEVKVPYLQKDFASSDADLNKLAQDIQNAKAVIFQRANAYIQSAKSYLRSCSQDAGTTPYEYARNIASYTSDELAYLTDSLGYAMIDFTNSLIKEASTGGELGLAEGTPSACFKGLPPPTPVAERGDYSTPSGEAEPFSPGETPGETEVTDITKPIPEPREPSGEEKELVTGQTPAPVASSTQQALQQVSQVLFGFGATAIVLGAVVLVTSVVVAGTGVALDVAVAVEDIAAARSAAVEADARARSAPMVAAPAGTSGGRSVEADARARSAPMVAAPAGTSGGRSVDRIRAEPAGTKVVAGGTAWEPRKAALESSMILEKAGIKGALVSLAMILSGVAAVAVGSIGYSGFAAGLAEGTVCGNFASVAVQNETSLKQAVDVLVDIENQFDARLAVLR